MRTTTRFARILSAVLVIFAGCLRLDAQTRIEVNEARNGNLTGRAEADTWVFEVADHNSDLHFEVLTAAGKLHVMVYPFGQKRPIKIRPVGGKGQSTGAETVIIGQKIEATQAAGFKLPAGKYQIQVKPSRDHGGPYSVRIIEPALGEKEPAADTPLPEKPAATGDPQSIEALLRRMTELEKRVSQMEEAEKERKAK